MRQHLWYENPTSAMHFNSLCRMENVSWVNVRGFDAAKPCEDCIGRLNRLQRLGKTKLSFLNARNMSGLFFFDAEHKGRPNLFWTRDLQPPYDAKVRRWARKIAGEEKRRARSLVAA